MTSNLKTSKDPYLTDGQGATVNTVKSCIAVTLPPRNIHRIVDASTQGDNSMKKTRFVGLCQFSQVLGPPAAQGLDQNVI